MCKKDSKRDFFKKKKKKKLYCSMIHKKILDLFNIYNLVSVERCVHS